MGGAPKTFRDRHDVVAFGSVVAMILPLGIGGLWLATEAAMNVLDVGDGVSSWRAVVLLASGLAGFGWGLLLGSVLWVRLMARALPAQTLRRWMLGSGGGPLRPYAERLLDVLVAPT